MDTWAFLFKKERTWRHILLNSWKILVVGLKSKKFATAHRRNVCENAQVIYVCSYLNPACRAPCVLALKWGVSEPVCTNACATGRGLTQSVTHMILIQVGLCTERLMGVGDSHFWQRCILGWIMAWFPPWFYSLLLLCIRLFPFALQDSRVAGPATLPVTFFNHTGKSWCFVDGWASCLGHEAERNGISPFSQQSALGLGQGKLSLIAKEPCRKAVCHSGNQTP